MALMSAFAAQGATALVGTAAVQAPGSSAMQITWRVRCLATGYLTWGTTAAVVAVGGPGANTIGMAAGGIETFIFPGNSWFISNVAASFELTPGEGV